MTESLNDALKRVEKAANPEWKQRALRCIHWLCRNQESWDSDDFWVAMRRHYPDLNTHEPRALGALMRSCQSDGWLTITSEFKRSRLPVRHKRPIPIYRSLLLP